MEKMERTLATEVLHDMRLCVTRWKCAFFAMLAVEVVTLIVGYVFVR